MEHGPCGHAEQDRREDCSDQVAAVQSGHRRLCFPRPHHVDTHDRREHSEPAGHEREDDARNPEDGQQGDAEDHRTDVLRRRRLEQVRPAAGAVAHVVADEICDDRGISRVVLRDAGLDLADQIRPDIGGLRVDAASQLREERDEARAKSKANDGQDEIVLRRGRREGAVPVIEDRDTREGEADDRKAGHGAAAKGDYEGVVEGFQGSRGGPDVRPDRDLHPDEAGEGGEGGPEGEGAGRLQAKLDRVRFSRRHRGAEDGPREDDRQDDGDDRDAPVLPAQEGPSPLLDRGRDLPHPVVAGVPPQDVPRQEAREPQARQDRKGDDDAQVDLRHRVLSVARPAPQLPPRIRP